MLHNIVITFNYKNLLKLFKVKPMFLITILFLFIKIHNIDIPFLIKMLDKYLTNLNFHFILIAIIWLTYYLEYRNRQAVDMKYE